jgi:POT family proton-dependent oligopeptide transporter
MRSIVQAISLLTNAVAAAIGEALVPLSDDPNLVWNYVTCTMCVFISARKKLEIATDRTCHRSLAAVGGIGFFLSFRDLDRQEETLNELPPGKAWPKVPASSGTGKVSFFSRFRSSSDAEQAEKTET